MLAQNYTLHSLTEQERVSCFSGFPRRY